MTTLTLETEPLAVAISFEADKLIVELADGQSSRAFGMVSPPHAWF